VLRCAYVQGLVDQGGGQLSKNKHKLNITINRIISSKAKLALIRKTIKTTIFTSHWGSKVMKLKYRIYLKDHNIMLLFISVYYIMAT
jgi:hypothetical protein